MKARISSSEVSGAMLPIQSLVSVMSASRISIFLGYVLVRVVRLAVALRLAPLGQLHLLARRGLVRDLAEQVADGVEARALLVVRSHHVPRRPGRIGRLEHLVAPARIVVPA